MTATTTHPEWMRTQLAAAQADNDNTTAWTDFIWTPNGLVANGGAHDRQHAETYLTGLRRTGLVAPSK